MTDVTLVGRVRTLLATLSAMTTANPVLLQGELWTEKDAGTGLSTGRRKMGDGVTAFNALAFEPAAGSVTNLTIANSGASTLDVASDTGTDATIPAATNAAAGLATAAQITKLEGIATGATANATNADLRDRSTHTGTQAAGTITGLSIVATTGAYADLSGRPTLGTAAATASTDYAPAAQGVTNGNSHDHNGGDGAQIAYSSLSGTPTLGTLAAQSGTFSGTSSGTNTGDQDLSGLVVKASNLSDLVSSSTARTNLGLGSLATQSGTFSGTSSGTNTGDQTISLTGEATGSGTGSFAVTLTNASVIDKVLTGYVSGAGTVAATDTILGAIQKLNGNDAAFLTSATAASTYQPLDSDLTSIAALSTAAFGRSLLTQATAEAARLTLQTPSLGLATAISYGMAMP